MLNRLLLNSSKCTWFECEDFFFYTYLVSINAKLNNLKKKMFNYGFEVTRINIFIIYCMCIIVLTSRKIDLKYFYCNFLNRVVILELWFCFLHKNIEIKILNDLPRIFTNIKTNLNYF